MNFFDGFSMTKPVLYCALLQPAGGKKISSVCNSIFFFSRMATMRCDCVPVKQRWKQGNPISCCDPCWSAAQFGEWCCCFDKSPVGVTAGFQRLSESTESLVYCWVFLLLFFLDKRPPSGGRAKLHSEDGVSKRKTNASFCICLVLSGLMSGFSVENSWGRSILSHSGPIWHPEDVTEVKLAQ